MNEAGRGKRLKLPLHAPRLNNAKAPCLVVDCRLQRYTIIDAPHPCQSKISAEADKAATGWLYYVHVFGPLTCLGRVFHMQLGKYFLTVAAYGVSAYTQPVGNDLTCQTFIDESEHLFFP